MKADFKWSILIKYNLKWIIRNKKAKILKKQKKQIKINISIFRVIE